jgi:hypothetical protein
MKSINLIQFKNKIPLKKLNSTKTKKKKPRMIKLLKNKKCQNHLKLKKNIIKRIETKSDR